MNEHRGRKPKYLTIERFEKWVSNDYWHLTAKVNIIFWVMLTILAAIIASWAVG